VLAFEDPVHTVIHSAVLQFLYALVQKAKEKSCVIAVNMLPFSNYLNCVICNVLFCDIIILV